MDSFVASLETAEYLMAGIILAWGAIIWIAFEMRSKQQEINALSHQVSQL